MLKSIELINKLNNELEIKVKNNEVIDFFIELRINQKINIYIISDFLKIEDINFEDISPNEIENKNIVFEFLNVDALNDVRYSHFFNGNRVSLGLRRSLNTLLNKNGNENEKRNVLTFYSYKGGVGRTTSLALTATYLARKGKNIFVIDCDFEAPGLLNFFKSSQSNNCKSGLIEYLNDILFDENTNIDDYIYNIEKSYSGSGNISLIPAGNILSSNDNLLSYLEGIAKIDLQGDVLVSTLIKLIDIINNKYNPDLIIVDSRTGFNNILGALSRISKHIVFLAGDDVQNQPGIEYFTRYVNDNNIDSTFVLSIISSNYSRRLDNFNKYINSLTETEPEIFYFDRQNSLEFIGTQLEDSHDVDDFINGENGSPQYHRFFNHIYQVVSSNLIDNEISDVASIKDEDEDEDIEDVEDIDIYDTQCNQKDVNISIQDRVLMNIRDKFPDLYAENINFKGDYIDKYFYFRPCMEDFLIPEKNILLGDKGTGKTAFYKALQLDDFFEQLVVKSQKKHMHYKVINITNLENDNFEFLGFDKHLNDELFIRNFWLFFIWNALCTRWDFNTKCKDLIIKLSDPKSQSKIINLISNSENIERIVDELDCINNELRKNDERLIITFDQLDNMVKPIIWNNVISPLLKMVIKFPYENIHPKLFLRRDLYDRLGNLTNKNSFISKIIDLEWSQNEMFSYFLKIIFADSKESFFEFLSKSNINNNLIITLKRKIKTKGKVHNQLPLDKSLIEPVINAFFGFSRPLKNKIPSSAYEDLYRNIQSADGTVNLRPFIDLIINAIKEQDEQDERKGFRGDTVIGLAYCTSKNVRKNAVVKYLEDLWNEQGNEFVKCFCVDFSTNKMNKEYKRSNFYEDVFDRLIEHIKSNNITDYPSIAMNTIDDLKQILIATKIITTYLVGNSTRYRIAYLYTNYLGV